eukprot:4233153-Karenia_brevis.AAC.1
MSLWIPFGKTYKIGAILDEAGQVISQGEGGIAKALADGRRSTFSPKFNDADKARGLLKFVPSKWTWDVARPSIAVLKNVLRLATDSGVGPDGIPYSAYRA